jgi:hypothetical protein
MAIIKKTSNNRCWQECGGGGKGKRYILLLGMQTRAATMEISTEVIKNLKKNLPYDPAIHLN